MDWEEKRLAFVKVMYSPIHTTKYGWEVTPIRLLNLTLVVIVSLIVIVFWGLLSLGVLKWK